MKGLILAGGSGSRLYPITRSVNKQLLPIYNKPMIYYPLTTLMLGGVRDIMIITNPAERAAFENLLGDGSRWGLTLSYVAQTRPGGLPEAFIYGAEFIGGSGCVLILGDNVYFGQGLSHMLHTAITANQGMTAFGYRVTDPQNFGVVEFDAAGKVVSLEEKPAKPRSSYAVTGLYICDAEVVNIARGLKPSARGELEIIDVLKHYLARGRLTVNNFGRGIAWLDTGSPHGLLQAAQFVESVETRQGVMIACPEEIAYRRGYIDRAQLLSLAEDLSKTGYGAYLRQIADEAPSTLPI
ncbi:MAG: glucose-1-phosphate thymidylyltransferase RfbA [Rhodospirillaceae bacterium]|nr:glucose-1-phosphate thymidylyltransferase RfbA [Rhodospirillaceae bacterium]